MNFSDSFSHSNKLVAFSPSGFYLASCLQFKLQIRDIRSLQVLHHFQCIDTIQQFQWSPDSMFVLCVMKKRGIMQLWSLEFPEWRCKIDEGSAGLSSACWTPDSRHILATAEFSLRVTLWSISNTTVSYMKHPKACAKHIDFSPCGRYMALAERRDLHDAVSTFACHDSWRLLRHWRPATADMAGVAWSPDGRALAVWDGCLHRRVCVYDVEGELLGNYDCGGGGGEAEMPRGLGVRSVVWSPGGHFLGVAAHDAVFRLLNAVDWRPVAAFVHSDTVDVADRTRYTATVAVYREVPVAGGKERYRDPTAEAGLEETKFELCTDDATIQIPTLRPDPSRANPRVGVCDAVFSADSRHLATRLASAPSAVWVWEVGSLRCAALLLTRSPVRAMAWAPPPPTSAPAPSGDVGTEITTECRLVFCTGQPGLYMWSPKGAMCVQVPEHLSRGGRFSVHSVCWHPSGRCVLLLSDTETTVCFLDEGAAKLATGAAIDAQGQTPPLHESLRRNLSSNKATGVV